MAVRRVYFHVTQRCKVIKQWLCAPVTISPLLANLYFRRFVLAWQRSDNDSA